MSRLTDLMPAIIFFIVAVMFGAFLDKAFASEVSQCEITDHNATVHVMPCTVSGITGKIDLS